MRARIGFTAIGFGAALAVAMPAAAQPAREHLDLVASLGGEYLGPQADYVQGVGERMAQAAGMRRRCVFTVLNSEVVNAFTAPPGCYVYVTRGLLSIMNSEAELAGVLGHELGHVSAQHARRQEQAEQITGLAAALVGAATKSGAAGKIAGRIGKLGTLGYSRSQEYEADQLALGYMPLAGYAPEGLTRVLGDLQREDAFTARTSGRSDAGGTPVWARTHPLTTDRIQRVEAQVARTSLAEGLGLEEEPYLTAINGLPYSGDPAQGFVRGGSYVHPSLGIRFDAPRGFALTNEAEAVKIVGPGGTLAEFTGGRATARQLDRFAHESLMRVIQRGRHELDPPQRTVINGLDVVILPARTFSGGRPVDLVSVAYSLGGDEAYGFIAMTPAGQAATFDAMFNSFRRLSDRERRTFGGKRIAVTTVKSGDTSESLAALMPPERDRLARFEMLNGLEPGEQPRPGSKVKVVVDGRR
jgi:predicted Zn-dependent protease